MMKHLKSNGVVFSLFTILVLFYSPASFGTQSVDSDLIGKFRNTFYYVALEEAYAGSPSVAIEDRNGNTIAVVSAQYKRALDIEGTGKLRDGRVVNYAGRVNGTIRYHLTEHPYGRGAGNCALVPYYTVAVDPSKIALGSIVQIDETIGMELPDGSIHSGLWRAEDTGGAIKKDRIDLFIGDGNDDTYLMKAGIKHLEPLTLRLVALPAITNCVEDTPRF